MRHIKDFLDIVKNYGVLPILNMAGLFALALFGLSLIPSLSFVPKAFVLFVLTH